MKASARRRADSGLQHEITIRTHTVGAWGTSPATAASSPYSTTTSSTTGVSSSTLSIVWTGSASGVAKKGDVFTIANVYAVNPVSGDTLSDTDVLVLKGKIAAIGKALKAPDGVKVVDLKGMFVMPGIIDTHCHLHDPAYGDVLKK